MDTTTSDADIARVLEQTSVREASARAFFLSAIRDIGREGSDFTLERLADLMRVEEHFQTLLLYDQLDFLREPYTVTEAERDFALSVQRIWLEAANGYQRFLRARNRWADSPKAIDTMFRVTGLALNSIHCYVKWGYFLAESGRVTPWKQLHALYALAESDGYSQVPFVLHNSQPSFKPSAQSLYLRTLMLDLINTGNLSKVQIEIADGWFSSWCGDYALDAEYSSRQHLFFVDLASERGMHAMQRDSHGETMRYIRADGLKAQIEEVQAGLRHGRLYAGYGAGAVFPVEEHIALLAIVEKLYHSILAGSENRVEERTPLEDREVEAALGIELLMRKIREAPVGPARKRGTAVDEPDALSLEPRESSLDDGLPPDPDLARWRVRDFSSTGYGLLVDRPTAEDIRLNGILGLRNQESGGWIVGHVVRKLPNRVRGEMLLGVEVLAYHPLRVDLQPETGPPVEALYFPGLDINGKLDALLLRVSDFSAQQAFALRIAGINYQIRLNRVIRKGADWIKVRFEIESAS